MFVDQRQLAVSGFLLCLLAVFFLFAGIGIADLLHDYSDGGHRWQQGDWLIHSLSGPVRRGTIGTGIIYLSDVLSVSPLAVTIVLQMIIVTSLMAVILVIGSTVLTHPAQIAVLLLPPFYPVMMVSRFDGMIYKDVLAILALAILTLGVIRSDHARWLMPVGVLVLVIGCFSHEALIFFFPVAAFLIHLSGRTRGNQILIGLLGIGTAAALAFAVVYSWADPAPICAELLARGLNPVLCEGPISWLGASIEDAVDSAQEKSDAFKWIEYISVWLISALVLGFLLGRDLRQVLVLAVLTLVPFLPLFIVAFDFGRWFSFGFSSLVFVLLATGGFRQQAGQTAVAIVAIMASAVLTYDSTAGVYLSGLLNRALALVS